MVSGGRCKISAQQERPGGTLPEGRNVDFFFVMCFFCLQNIPRKRVLHVSRSLNIPPFPMHSHSKQPFNDSLSQVLIAQKLNVRCVFLNYGIVYRNFC